ncbi:MAG TPA: helix-turn-helix domain-containing protein [Bordetella sp.]
MPQPLQRLIALRHVASQISADEDIDALLRDLLRSACQQGGWDMGAIMSIDLANGYGTVVTRHEATILHRLMEERWDLATSPSLIALQKGEPIYIRNAQESEQFPGYRREAKLRGYRTVLVCPVASSDTEGRPLVLSVSSRQIRDVDEELMAFMTTIVHLGAIAIERAHRNRAKTRHTEQLQRVLGAQRTLLRDVLEGEPADALATTLDELLNGPVLIADFFGGSLVGSRSPVPGIYGDAAWRGLLAGPLGREVFYTIRDAVKLGRKSSIALPLGHEATIEAEVESLTVDAETVGALLTFGQAPNGDLHALMMESARFALSVHFMRSVIQFRYETRTLTELFFEIVERRWRDEQDVLYRGHHLGLALAEPLRMLVIDYPQTAGRGDNPSVECQNIVTLLARQQGIALHVVTVGGGLVCLIPQAGNADPDGLMRLARRMAEALRRPLGCEPIVVLSDTCVGLERLAMEWERCWRMIRIARDFGKSGVLGMPDLGPLPMLVGAADSADVRDFIHGAIGKLVECDQQTHSPYLETLAAYLRSGCRGQPCADAMGLHVTTLRYRLSRIKSLFGIDLDSPERRFAIELAINLHKLTRGESPATGSPESLHRT